MTRGQACWLPALLFVLLAPAAMAAAPAAANPASADPASADQASAGEAWARAAASTAQMAAAYLTLHGGGGDQVTGFSTPAAASATLHQSQKVGAVVQMRPVDTLALAPGQSVTLAPGGYHVMLMGLVKPLRPGDHFPLTVTFAHAGPITIEVTVGRAGATGPMGMDMSGHTHP